MPGGSSVQYEEMRPHELRAALEVFPVACVPVGSLEWHSRHLPYGTDTLKAHGILARAAQKYGGVVAPATYWGRMDLEKWKDYYNPAISFGSHPALPEDLVGRFFTSIFQGLVAVGFRVVIGVTGHDCEEQLFPLREAAASICDGNRSVGFAMQEFDLNPSTNDVGGDHAAKWETSYIMALRPDLVDMDRIADEDPRINASARAGERAIEMIVDAIEAKAQELLRSVCLSP
jgi:creatinine amidohydrolase